MVDDMQPINRKYGSYICVNVIGGGGQTAVFTAMHEVTGRIVALRVMTVTAKDVDAAIKECQYALRELSELDIPNIVKIEDFGVADETIYFAMNIVDGGSLMDRMKAWSITGGKDENMRLPSPIDILSMLRRIAITLDHLHALGLVHGQIGTRSIMFDDGNVLLGDIGLTKLTKIIYRLDNTNSFNMTKYSAPELWRGERPSPETDQYALACVMYELLTGQAPFESPSIFDLMNAHTDSIATPPHYIRKDLPKGLSMVFWQALAKPTNKRFPTVLSFYEALKKQFGDNVGRPTDFFTFSLD